MVEIEGYAAAFAAGLLFAVSDVLVRLGARTLQPVQLLLASLVFGTPILLAAAATSGDPLPGGRVLAYYVLAGLLNFVVGRLLFYYAVAGAGAATASISTSPTVIFSALLAWLLLGEPLDPRVAAGLLLVFLGVLLASLEPSGRPLQGARSRPAVVAGVASSLVFASTSILVRAAGVEGGSPSWGVAISYASALPIVAAYSLAKLGPGKLLPLRDPGIRYAAGAAVAVAAAQLSRYVSLHLLPVAYAVILISMFPVHTVVLASLVSGEAREKVGMRHLAGALTAFSGIAVALGL